MKNLQNLRKEFDALGGVLGLKNGQPAYGYIRVSDPSQSEEGAGGLPRQLEHLHEVAVRNGYGITWDRLFADDDSGFEFVSRPGLTRLRQECKTVNKKANVVIIEYLDRLSRNADWHQGFLLDEMKKNGLTVLFWKSFGSRVERAVMGAISQDGMELAKERMKEGKINKAKDGKVTSSKAAFGYRLANGRRQSCYEIDEETRFLVVMIFESLASGKSLRQISIDLQKYYPKDKPWAATSVRAIVRNSVYKGEFIANRFDHSTVMHFSDSGDFIKKKRKMVERPQEEWVIVPVPAIISEDLWNRANAMLAVNKQTARRNAKLPYLLTGFLRCAFCGYSYVGRQTTSKTVLKSGEINRHKYRLYSCSISSRKHSDERLDCNQASIEANRLEQSIWSAVVHVITDPAIVLKALDEKLNSEGQQNTREQISYIEKQIEDKKTEDSKLYRAYLADVFDEHEYKDRRKTLVDETAKLKEQLEILKSQIISPEEIESEKKRILAKCEAARKGNLSIEAEFDVKKSIIKSVVSRILLNVDEGWFELEGNFSGRYSLDKNIVYTSSLRYAHNLKIRFPLNFRLCDKMSVTVTGDKHAMR